MPDNSKRLDRSEIPKHIERAEKLLQKGKPAEALEEYLLVLGADQANDTVRQMAADICLSLQRVPDAVQLLSGLFERQTEAGDATRASLTYKKLARFAKPTCEQRIRFGQLLEGSNRKLALETYEDALQELIKLDRKADAMAVAERVVGLEANQQNLLRLAELASELGNNKQSASAFMKVAGLPENGANSSQWVEKAYAEDPGDPQIALAYGNGLLQKEEVGAAIFVLAPLATSPSGAPPANPEFTAAYAKALIAAKRFSEASPLIWQLFELDAGSMKSVVNLVGMFLDAEQDTEAVELARKLGEHQRARGDRRTYLAMLQEMAESHRQSAEMLEYLSEEFNANNRESEYFQTLVRLFDVHYSRGEFEKAAEALDRSAEVDAYDKGQQERLQKVRGKIDENRYNVIAARFQSLATPAGQVQTEEKALGASTLQDLILQAEILVQYGMRSKAIERLQRIQELFPHEEEHNPDLQQLYLTAGITLPTRAAPTSSTPPAAAPVATPAKPAAPAPPAGESGDITSFTRISEITRKLYRQNNAENVLATAAQEIGAQWKIDRCVVAMRKPGLAPALVKEHRKDSVEAAKAGTLEQVVAAAQDLALKEGSLTISSAKGAAQLSPVRESIETLGVGSLLAINLTDGNDQVGVMLLMDSQPRMWTNSDVMMLKTISEQIVIALNNAGLRRLVKNLSVTDEKSGLLKRASYLDLLMAETRRAAQNRTPVSILLLRLGDRAFMVKEFGETSVEVTMRQMGPLLAANIRQNDLAFRYDTTTVAIVLGETTAAEGLVAAEKIKNLVSKLKIAEKEVEIPFHAGLAEAVVREQFDPVDIVTEAINRAERALATAITHESGHIEVLAPSLASAAVA